MVLNINIYTHLEIGLLGKSKWIETDTILYLQTSLATITDNITY